jgi:hypothetical protein
VRYFDPLAPPRNLQPQVEVLQQAARSRVGIVGSRLVGLARPDSDVDVVIYGPREKEAGKRLLDRLATHRSDPVEPSIAFHAFLNACTRAPADIEERNIYTGIISWDSRYCKIDIVYGRTLAPLAFDSLPWPVSIGPATLEEIRVTEDSERHLFPGTLIGQLPDDRRVHIWIRDHALHYVVANDILKFECVLLDSPNVEQEVVATKLISVTPTRSAPAT